ncbi:FHA domain-containing protein [Bacillus massiliglaciei]|uniref:FHA domain-containing protein n=1 Tax=Bacillus massiliglaciei TaxID=1816693 RepID=UPI000DA62679|nr:FHA domain-containing protein [Bacillus massiliglaciei]
MSITAYKIGVQTAQKEPFDDFVYVSEGRSILIGRASRHSQADLALYNDFVSREHCRMYIQDETLYIEDLNSKHGTAVNGVTLVPETPCPIQPGDALTLVNGLVRLYVTADDDVTRDLTSLTLQLLQTISVNEHLQTVLVHGTLIKMPAKEFTCFQLLYARLGNLTTKEEIILNVWPERTGDPQHIVSAEEITSLLYRVRKRLKGHFSIHSVPHKGYYMEYAAVELHNA